MQAFFKKYKVDLVLIILLFLALPLFFYKLGQSSLVSFDEAWYGDIARNILKNGDFVNLTWNGDSYTDHPPSGFWLIALSEKFLGGSELAVRFPAALLGFLSLIVVYLLGKELFGRAVGFFSALGLTSSFWFIFRARSGNLDVPLTFFFLLTLFLAVKAVNNKKYLIPLSLSLSFLLLIKTLVPLIIIPVLVVIFGKAKGYKLPDFILPVLIPGIVFCSWFLIQQLKDDNFYNYYLFKGLPGVKLETDYQQNLFLIKEYLHAGVGKWFWPGLLAIFLSFILRQRRFLVLSLFFLIFFIPFIFSEKGHIWHLIPLHPVMILAFWGVAWVLVQKLTHSKVLFILGAVAITFYVLNLQVKQMWYQFIDIPSFVSDEAILSKEVGKYPYKFYIDGDFYPVAVYYSEKKVQQIWFEALPTIFKEVEPFLLITKQERLDGAKIKKNAYRVLKTDRDKILILKN